MSKFNELYKKIFAECSEITKEGLFTGDNNISLSVGNSSTFNTDVTTPIDVTTGDIEASLPLPLPLEEDDELDLSLKCEICGSDLNDDANNDFACNDVNFSHDHICRACAEKEAEKYQDQFTNGEVEEEHILEFSDNTSEYGDSWYSCSLCHQLCPENELQETDSGMLCQDCINSLDSRGEEYTVIHNHNRY